MFVDDEQVNGDQEISFFRRVYCSSFDQIEGVLTDVIEKQSRLLGFDTQEAPRGPGRRGCQVPQPLWHERREFLQQELHELRGDIADVDQARILGDCYGVDIYDRLLLDICGVYNAEMRPAGVQPVPTLQRLEIAKKALCTGYAFPTNHYFVTDELWQEFQEAIRQRRGSFSRDRFVHPTICKRERHKMEKGTNAAR